MLPAHAPVLIPLMLVPFKKPDTQCCPRLRFLCMTGDETFGLDITGEAVVLALSQEALDAGFLGLWSLEVVAIMPLGVDLYLEFGAVQLQAADTLLQRPSLPCQVLGRKAFRDARD